MQPAIEDAKKDFKLSKVIFKSPQEWALNAQNQVIDSCGAGVRSVPDLPRDVNGTNGKINELADKNIPVILVGGPVNEADQGPLHASHDVADSAYQGTKHSSRPWAARARSCTARASSWTRTRSSASTR